MTRARDRLRHRVQLHNEQFRRAYRFNVTDRILDVGCGTGQTTREAARLAPA